MQGLMVRWSTLQSLITTRVLPPGLVDQVGCILFNSTESISSFYQAKIGLPLGRISYEVSCGSGYKLSFLRDQRQVLSYQTWVQACLGKERVDSWVHAYLLVFSLSLILLGFLPPAETSSEVDQFWAKAQQCGSHSSLIFKVWVDLALSLVITTRYQAMTIPSYPPVRF